jgi:TonB family protein
MKFLLIPILTIAFAAVAFSQEPEIRAINKPEPAFPAEDKDANYGQEVKVAVRVNKKGEVSEARAWGMMVPCSNTKDPVTRSIENAALEAAKNTTFAPIMKDGKATEMDLLITYRLKPKPQPIPPGSAKYVSGGVLNGNALSLPKPGYPMGARSAGASGAVAVQVLIREDGHVISAGAISGNPLLHDGVVEAACSARFAPTLLQGNPVKVSGVVTYNFIPWPKSSIPHSAFRNPHSIGEVVDMLLDPAFGRYLKGEDPV